MNIIKESEFSNEVLEKLHHYSEGTNIFSFSTEATSLKNELDLLKEKYNFPAVKDDVGQFLSFLSAKLNIKSVFEFGSGYGHSAYWYFLNNPSLEKVILTEKREDLQSEFEQLSWPSQWSEKISYFQQDAFEVLDTVKDIDLFLVDGVKGDYLKFIRLAKEKMSKNGIIIIDNAFWRGLFLDKSTSKNSAKAIGDLHSELANDKSWNKSFLPFRDGVILLSKLD